MSEGELIEDPEVLVDEAVKSIEVVPYIALFLMSIFPIYYGSYRSLFSVKTEQMKEREIFFYPILLSITLFGLYLIFQMIDESYVNLLIGVYFSIIGVFSMKVFLSPILSVFFPKNFSRVLFSVPMSKITDTLTCGFFHDDDDDEEDWIEKISITDVFSLTLGVCISSYYYLTKNWIASNVFGFAFSVTFIEFCDLGSFKNGFFLLVGLFFYDIYWVYFTDVMVTVAKKFEGPVKMIWPREGRFAMIGLGDIVIPGIFLALMYRFDKFIAKKRGYDKSYKTYFMTSLIFYCIGWIAAIIGVHILKAGQPALLYLVPLILGSVLVVAWKNKEYLQLIHYESESINKKKKK